MRLEAEWKFGEFRLDPAERHVWHGETLVPLRPKLFATLSYLVEHAGRLITREELLRAIWSRTHVDETLLRGTMRELRSALGDDAEHPQFIETVPHQGYRFVAAVTRVARPDSRDTSLLAAGTLVERRAELDKLEGALGRALDRRRQVVLVTGDAGMGKTALVDAWTSGLSNRNGVLVARGQCVEQYGAAEAFLPILEAVAQACRGRSGKRVLATLAQYAPTWLVQLPSLLTDTELDRLQRATQGAGRDRMLREMAEAIEALSVEMPITLLLEDLHWSDPSTVDLLGMLARRREPARLLVLGTYRPADVIITGHPMRTLKQELHARGLCEEIALEFLTPAGVAEYLDARSGGTRAAAARRERYAADHADRPTHELATLARLVHRRCDGNPLFVVTMVDYLVDREAIRPDVEGWHTGDDVGQLENGVPDGLKQLIERQLERLSEDDQQLLQAASVAGTTFTSTAVAAALDVAVDQVDERCDRLVGRAQFLDWHHAGSRPDGVAASHYQFRHALYQQVLYARLSSGRLARLHRRIGEREEAVWGARASEHAAALAMHFERAHDYARALPYLAHVAKSAMVPIRVPGEPGGLRTRAGPAGAHAGRTRAPRSRADVRSAAAGHLSDDDRVRLHGVVADRRACAPAPQRPR